MSLNVNSSKTVKSFSIPTVGHTSLLRMYTYIYFRCILKVYGCSICVHMYMQRIIMSVHMYTWLCVHIYMYIPHGEQY